MITGDQNPVLTEAAEHDHLCPKVKQEKKKVKEFILELVFI